MGGSCDLEGVSGVISSGFSPASTSICTDTLLPLDKHCVSVGKTGEEAVETDNCFLEDQICMDFSKSINLGVKKGLHKSSTFPTSVVEVEQDSDSGLNSDEVMKDAPAYERSLSLPLALKPISAMKGSRQKNGMTTPNENRHVKWAADVYDPPVTSVSHSVSSSYRYQRRSKPRKKDKNKEKSKQKKKQKTKSKKSHQNPSSGLQTPDPGVENVNTSDDQSSLKEHGKHEAVIMDYSVGKEANCGSSFLRESVTNMHFSIAEAS